MPVEFSTTGKRSSIGLKKTEKSVVHTCKFLTLLQWTLLLVPIGLTELHIKPVMLSVARVLMYGHNAATYRPTNSRIKLLGYLFSL